MCRAKYYAAMAKQLLMNPRDIPSHHILTPGAIVVVDSRVYRLELNPDKVCEMKLVYQDADAAAVSTEVGNKRKAMDSDGDGSCSSSSSTSDVVENTQVKRQKTVSPAAKTAKSGLFPESSRKPSSRFASYNTGPVISAKSPTALKDTTPSKASVDSSESEKPGSRILTKKSLTDGSTMTITKCEFPAHSGLPSMVFVLSRKSGTKSPSDMETAK